jgi:hypothetical protein
MDLGSGARFPVGSGPFFTSSQRTSWWANLSLSRRALASYLQERQRVPAIRRTVTSPGRNRLRAPLAGGTPRAHAVPVGKKYAAAATIGAVLAFGHAWKLLLVLGVVALAGYLFSLRAHPRDACPACKGTGQHRGWFWSVNWRACRRCGGGQRHRGGVRAGLAGEQGQARLPGNRRRGGA